MFTGIIETVGEVSSIREVGSNREFDISSSISQELRVDQSVSHNGACLTVVKVEGDRHTVVAVKETLLKTSLGSVRIGDKLNLERSMIINGRLDGHIVQGHVDQTGICTGVTENQGSWQFNFEYTPGEHVLVEKGSVCVNGVSLTVFNIRPGVFSVAIIPYTFEHTSFSGLKAGDTVNLEFDIIGKYVAALLKKSAI